MIRSYAVRVVKDAN